MKKAFFIICLVIVSLIRVTPAQARPTEPENEPPPATYTIYLPLMVNGTGEEGTPEEPAASTAAPPENDQPPPAPPENDNRHRNRHRRNQQPAQGNPQPKPKPKNEGANPQPKPKK